jgi:hypothetical protein
VNPSEHVHFFASRQKTKTLSSTYKVTLYNVILRHSKEFSGNQGKHQNFDPSILPYKFGLIFMGKKAKKNSKWPTQKN